MAASYPTSIKSFLTYQDQPPGPTSIVPDPTNPGATVDLTIDRAKATNEIHDEVIAMETAIGLGTQATIVIPGTRTMGAEINALYNGKAWGRVDPNNNAIYPNVMPTHNHPHNQLSGKNADDHPQYMRVDGTRGFTNPVNGQWATAMNDLVTLAQVESAGYLNYNQVQSVIEETILAETPYPVRGPYPQPWPQRYRMTGGVSSGYTDSNGMLRVDYSDANFVGVLTFVYMKLPFPGRSAYGYVYQYEEDQLVLFEVDNQGAWIIFTEDIVVDRQAWVAMVWMVVGV
jgi:hypothetical protein